MTTLDDVQAGRAGKGKVDRFKVGDRVRATRAGYLYEHAETGTIEEADGDGCPYVLLDRGNRSVYVEDRWLEVVAPPTPPTPTVRVRIAVAVDANGGWYAAGSATLSDAAALEFAGESMDRPTLHWITADLPLPSVPEVVGMVEGQR